ncbi:GNAT family N-acetyltransferase [Frankia sp. CcI49]|uniref:GNAT family N-acetyltransferase n=1 Tax=unclassified Frankia TaxID=2632575 RepID=UPI0006CA428F|nr:MULTISPECIES: GNAT family N-acetyltransferase [unclassified Frankia]KPM57080.1 acetyltransferase [Frankia sp. R43]ONH60175.1 GNAT family N-acetyltransferase [Frankia sp. CcI49]
MTGVTRGAIPAGRSQAVVRPARLSDAAAIRAIYAPYVLETPITFEVEVPGEEVMRARMTARPLMPWFVAEIEGEVAGYAYASQHRERAAYRWSADVSIYLAGRQRRRGLGRLLYTRLIDEVRTLGYVTLFAGIALPNEASVGLHTALGFRPVGVYPAVGHKAGRWHDVGWYALLPPGSPPADPAEPREWDVDHQASESAAG